MTFDITLTAAAIATLISAITSTCKHYGFLNKINRKI